MQSAGQFLSASLQSPFYVPRTLPGVGDSMVSKNKKELALLEFTILCWRQNLIKIISHMNISLQIQISATRQETGLCEKMEQRPHGRSDP